ncbi:hypothetical protein J2X05_004112 [Cellvibrio fibrivorans]|uniref:Uncharacterized protein n=1 Tax=Cellvibrio fibrivorans TaxID=126350 RepID=A0ABU1V3P6_9GAMM|nr:hypothetical protein [Cellvibrio fibrivorans]
MITPNQAIDSSQQYNDSDVRNRFHRLKMRLPVGEYEQ